MQALCLQSFHRLQLSPEQQRPLWTSGEAKAATKLALVKSVQLEVGSFFKALYPAHPCLQTEIAHPPPTLQQFKCILRALFDNW